MAKVTQLVAEALFHAAAYAEFRQITLHALISVALYADQKPEFLLQKECAKQQNNPGTAQSSESDLQPVL